MGYRNEVVLIATEKQYDALNKAVDIKELLDEAEIRFYRPNSYDPAYWGLHWRGTRWYEHEHQLEEYLIYGEYNLLTVGSNPGDILYQNTTESIPTGHIRLSLP